MPVLPNRDIGNSTKKANNSGNLLEIHHHFLEKIVHSKPPLSGLQALWPLSAGKSALQHTEHHALVPEGLMHSSLRPHALVA
jgi:hypothetical protein